MKSVAIPMVVVALLQNPAAPQRDAVTKAPIGTAMIAGTVVTDDTTPAPVRRARVTVRSESYGNGWSATTDDDGKFAVSALPAGRYSVQATKPAWLAANYGATRPGRPGTPIPVGDGESVAHITLVMSHGAVVTGTVRERSGEPVPGVIVTAMRWVYSDVTGEKVLTRASADATTDDQGVYRCFGLLPGEYVIVATVRSGPATALMDLRRMTADDINQALATGRPGGPPTASPANQQRPPLVGYAPVYFPGTADVGRAATVKISASEEKAGLNIALDVVPTARIDAVPALPDNANRQSLQVYLLAQQSLQAGASGMTTGRRDPEGHVIFSGVTPGRYTLIARAGVSGDAPPAPAAPAAGRGASALPAPPLTLYASVDLSVDGRDVPVPLELKPGSTVSGRVTFANPDRAPKDEAVSVALVPIRSGPALSVSPVRIGADGTFRLMGVPAGRYRVDYSAGPALDAWRLVSATWRNREVLDAPIEVRVGEDMSDLMLHFTDRPSELAGTLHASSGQPTSGYSIVVFSAAKEFWTPLSRRVQSLRPATDGSFSVRGLPAGEYYIAALTDIEPGEWYDPAFLEQLIPAAARVVVRDAARTVQDLRIK
jgi:protocatechuate 3,4-dioxygenase beta subunit